MPPETASRPRRPFMAQAAVARAAEPRLLDTFLGRAVPRRYSAFYSHLVSLLKMVLPSVAIGLVALVLLWPQLNPIDQRFRLKPVAVGIDDLENLRMMNPRYMGTDAQNQPYTITADRALQVSGDSNVTDLVNPKGDVTLKDGTWLALSADAGSYNKEEQVLDLTGNVNLYHDGGYEIATASARIDLAGNDAQGDDPVVGQGPDSELSGEGFRVYDRGERVVVTGQSRLLIRSGEGPAVR